MLGLVRRLGCAATASLGAVGAGTLYNKGKTQVIVGGRNVSLDATLDNRKEDLPACFLLDSTAGDENSKVISTINHHKLSRDITETVLSWDPFVTVIEGLLDEKECDAVVEYVKKVNALKPSLSHKADGTLQEYPERNSYSCFADIQLPFMRRLHEDVALIYRSPIDLAECPQVTFYNANRHNRPHYDRIARKEVEASGFQRRGTIVVFLSDPEDGGEFGLPYLNKLVKGKKGDAVMFRQIGPDGLLDRRLLHEGCDVFRGEKWIFNMWFGTTTPSKKRCVGMMESGG